MSLRRAVETRCRQPDGVIEGVASRLREMAMSRLFAFGCGFVALAAAVEAKAETFVTRSDDGADQATIVQSGTKGEKPTTRIKKGPGYVIIEQNSHDNRAVVFQKN